MFPKFTMCSSTCSAYKHLTFIPYAFANVVEDEGDFTVAEGHGYPLVWLNHSRDDGQFFDIFLGIIVTLIG
jgi:hypothetical protein